MIVAGERRLMRTAWRLGLIVAAVLSISGGVCAATFPERPLRLIVPGTGGSADFGARLVAQGLSTRLGQQVIVDNRPNGVVPVDIVIHAQPNGYTLLMYGSTVWQMPLVNRNVTYDPLRDLAPVTLAVSSPNIVVVPVTLPVKSIAELIALAKSKPNGLNYATTGTGNATHLAAELFKSMAGVQLVRVNYKAAGTALNELISGQTQVMFSPAAAVTPHIKAGKLNALAVTSPQPSVLYPELPTVASTGLPGYSSLAMTGIFAPAKTPAGLVSYLSSEISQVLHSPEVRDKLLAAGAEPVGNKPQELLAIMKSDIARMSKIVKPED